MQAVGQCREEKQSMNPKQVPRNRQYSWLWHLVNNEVVVWLFIRIQSWFMVIVRTKNRRTWFVIFIQCTSFGRYFIYLLFNYVFPIWIVETIGNANVNEFRVTSSLIFMSNTSSTNRPNAELFIEMIVMRFTVTVITKNRRSSFVILHTICASFGSTFLFSFNRVFPTRRLERQNKTKGDR